MAVYGTIVNNSKTISFAGSTQQLEWGKWVTTPTFPIQPQTTASFSAVGVGIAQ